MSEISMEARIHAHIDRLFAQVSAEPRISEVKLEIYMDTLDRYHDLCAQGMASEQAYEQSIGSIGDVEEILASLGIVAKNEQSEAEEPEQVKKKPVGKSRRKHLVSYIGSMLWMVMLSFYFIISFASEAWHITWLLFPIALALQSMIRAIVDLATINKPDVPYRFSPRAAKLKASLKSALWMTTLVLYFAISFIFTQWHLSWIIFLLGSAASNLLSMIMMYAAADEVKNNEEKEGDQE